MSNAANYAQLQNYLDVAKFCDYMIVNRLTDAASRARWALLSNFIQTAIIAESARWGDALGDGVTRTRDTHWTPEVNRVDGLMNGNVNRFITALTAQGYLPALAAPAFNKE